jgi:hypothetical protein
MALVKTNRSKRQKTLEIIVLNTLPHWTSVFLINYCMEVSGYYPVIIRYPVIIFSWPVSGRLLSGIRQNSIRHIPNPYYPIATQCGLLSAYINLPAVTRYDGQTVKIYLWDVSIVNTIRNNPTGLHSCIHLAVSPPHFRIYYIFL